MYVLIIFYPLFFCLDERFVTDICIDKHTIGLDLWYAFAMFTYINVYM